MAKYERKDRFYKKAKEEGKASRAYYKLEQIQRKYYLIKKGGRVVDLGCAPGGWMQEASRIVGDTGLVLGIDLLPIKITKRSNMVFVQRDINESHVLEIIKEGLSGADCVLSDMLPPTSGVKFRDSYLSYELALRALEIAKVVLKKGGNFVTKIFPGEEFGSFKKELKKYFDKVAQHRPEATRKSSIEVYLIGMGFLGS